MNYSTQPFFLHTKTALFLYFDCICKVILFSTTTYNNKKILFIFEKVFLDAPPHKQYRMSFTQFRADKGIPSGSENSLLPFCANSFY